ncbi:Vps5 C-terminal, partial [Phlyctochytrium arcticum]
TNTALSTCARVGDKVARLDTELAKDCEQVSSHMNAFALVEDKSVISACKRLGRAFAASGNLHTEQATFLSGSFVEECKKCLKDTQTAQAALDHRFATLQEYDSSCKLTQRKLVALDKIRSSSNIRQDKVDAALEDLQEAKEEESKGRRSFRTISEVLRPEFEKHLEQQEKDIQVVIDQYVNEQIQHSTRQLEVFKAALNDISLLDERMRYPENL